MNENFEKFKKIVEDEVAAVVSNAPANNSSGIAMAELPLGAKPKKKSKLGIETRTEEK